MQYLTGDYSAAAVSLGQALVFYRDLGNQLGEAEALNNLGQLLFASLAPADACAHYVQALDIAPEPWGRCSRKHAHWKASGSASSRRGRLARVPSAYNRHSRSTGASDPLAPSAWKHSLPSRAYTGLKSKGR